MSELDLKRLQNGSDIRGIARAGVDGEEPNLTEDTASLLAHGFCAWLSEKTGKPFLSLTVSIGRDPRLSGKALQDAAINAMAALGVRVLDCGLASTPAMFMSTVFPEYSCDGAVMITASHLPFNKNGFKYFDKKGGLNKSDIADIIERAESIAECPPDCDCDCEDCAPISEDPICGITSLLISECNLMDTYCTHLRSIIKRGVNAENPAACMASVPDNIPTYERPLAGLKIAVDAGNGSGGFYAEKVLAPLGADVSGSCFLEPDGNFPNHAPNPEDKKALAIISRRVLETGADFGLIFDTDVDRSAAVDENGREIARNGIVALAAVLAKEISPGTTIVTDSVTSDHLSEFLTQRLGLSHLRYKRGYKNVINKAIELNAGGTDCQLAIETSGHAAFKENYFLDDGAYLAAKIVIKAARLLREGKSLSNVISDLKEPQEAIEVRLPVTASNFTAYGSQVIKELEAWVQSQVTENTDGKTVMQLAAPNYEGVRISFLENSSASSSSMRPYGWCLLRMSLHDPIMPLNIEADKEGGCRQIAEILREFLAHFDELDISKL